MGKLERLFVADKVNTKCTDHFTREQDGLAQDWHGDEEKAQVAKCVGLRDMLKRELTGAKVFRVGKGDVTYYVVGKSKAGNLVGVKTTATET